MKPYIPYDVIPSDYVVPAFPNVPRYEEVARILPIFALTSSSSIIICMWGFYDHTCVHFLKQYDNKNDLFRRSLRVPEWVVEADATALAEREVTFSEAALSVMHSYIDTEHNSAKQIESVQEMQQLVSQVRRNYFCHMFSGIFLIVVLC